jgi:RNA polymerase sigma-70 factor (ECF subfamily)
VSGAKAYARALEPLLPQAGGYALSILRNRHDAEDAVQTAALRGLERLTGFDDTRPFKGWWFAILRNCCIDIVRRSNRVRFTALDGEIAAPPAAPENQDWGRLDRAIAAISPQHREIVRLRYFAELSYREIAEALAIPTGTVMSRLYLARKALAARLQEDAE